MKKLLSVILALCMVSILCLSASAGSYYEYNDKMSSIGMELTSALYLYSNNSGGIDVTGLTRIDTGSSTAYTSVTMYSRVYYSYAVPVNQYEFSDFDDRSKTVNNVSANSGYFISEHGLTYTGLAGVFGWGCHVGWTESYGTEVFDETTARSSVVTQYSLDHEAEVKEMMS